MDRTTGTSKVGPFKDSLLNRKILRTKFRILSEMCDLQEYLTQILMVARLILTTSHPQACRKAARQAQ